MLILVRGAVPIKITTSAVNQVTCQCSIQSAHKQVGSEVDAHLINTRRSNLRITVASQSKTHVHQRSELAHRHNECETMLMSLRN